MLPSVHPEMANLPDLLRQAQILILKILNVSLWLIRLRRIAFLELDQILSFVVGHYLRPEEKLRIKIL